MGWFDKKSWQLRRKIRDLQSELAVAEREGKYVVEQGLFFAELREMADATMMVVGTADHLDSEEETIIRNFLDRNGFSVEILRLDKTQKTLAAVEIIPPEELTRRVARSLKEAGYRLIDDSDQERPSNLEKQTITLSSLIRSISALFAAHVNQLIISTPIKMNMEGNRLLHWMPLIREALLRKVSTEVVAICREPFVSAYNHYYGQLGRMETTDALDNFSGDHPDDKSDNELSRSLGDPDPAKSLSDTPPWSASAQPSHTNPASRDPQNAAKTVSPTAPNRSTDAALTLAHMYKSLIGVSNRRQVRNAEAILENIARFFSAKSACLLTRKDPDAPFTLQANSTGTACMETTEEGSVTCDITSLEKAIAGRTVTILPPSGNGNTNPQAVVAPVTLQTEGDVALYILEPNGFATEVDNTDIGHLNTFIQVFREFPDLLIADTKKKK